MVHPRSRIACLNNDYENCMPLHQGQRTPKEDYTRLRRVRQRVSVELMCPSRKAYTFSVSGLIPGIGKG
jgi:hypothetical protein